MQQLHIPKNFPRIETFTDITQVMHLFSEETNPGKALAIILTDYVRMKMYWLKTENARYESKWGFDFFQFEKDSAHWENAGAYELEKEYYEWSTVISELKFYKDLQEKWS